MKNSVKLSLPLEREVRGYIIRRMPIGQFLAATQALQELPQTLVKALFPGEDTGAVLKALSGLTKESLRVLVLRALTELPEPLIKLFARLSGLEAESLLNDPAVGLDGLMELMDAWLEVNGIENFIKAAGALAGKVRKVAANAGSKG